MGYRDIYKESNEQAEERFLLVMERIAEIAEETDVPEKFDDYFKKTPPPEGSSLPVPQRPVLPA